MNLNEVEIMITEADVKKRISELGAEITKDYPDGNLLVVGVLKGAFIFMADLVRTIEVPITMDFIGAKSYGNASESSGNVQFTKDLSESVEGKHLLLVEDILDTGNTLYAVKEVMKNRGALSVKICCLLNKPSRRIIPINADYVGYDIPDEFVVGYGLDYAERFREFPAICRMKPDVVEKIKSGEK